MSSHVGESEENRGRSSVSSPLLLMAATLLCLLELLGDEPQCTAVFSHCTYDMLRDTIGDLGADL
jgi:hypothetical protein